MPYHIKERCPRYDPEHAICRIDDESCWHDPKKNLTCGLLTEANESDLLTDEDIIELYGWADANDILNP